ncbi:MAG: Exo-beta-D-glucosaminidase precursor [Firmicutes bacterium ADurb.Bin146]|nr:MAG: Exo-beta-D-glucosaminidase precursor [Firmicutes bacterium ADurb.Bin146]
MKMLLNGKWQLYYIEEKNANIHRPSQLTKSGYKCIEADVPGNVEADLVKAGEEKDPYIQENSFNFMKYEYYQWWYTKTIKISKDFYGDKYILVFDGIDTIADIYLDDILIGNTENMLVEHEFDVTDFISLGSTYTLSVRIYSVMNYIKNKEYTVWMRGCRHCSELPYIRKASHMMGWDILPRLVSAGIWKDVKLLAVKKTRITQAYYSTPVFYMNKIRMRFAYRFTTDHETLSGFVIRVRGKCQDAEFEYTVPAWFVSGNDGFLIDNPKLWWPRGYGEQNLYTVTMDLLYNDEVIDSRTDKIGLRTFKLERRFEKGNQEFKMYVNEVPIFINGTNHIALDILHSKDYLRQKKEIALAVECNCNMIRCWGGNVYPETEFYQLCDEYGIMVWQDFTFGNSNYPQSEEFYDKVYDEAEKVIKKFRNHASLVLWCGDNEIDTTVDGYWYPDEKSKYNRISRKVLEKAVQQNDPFRFYLKSSPEIPDDYDSYNVPEQHIWGPRAYFKDDFYKHVTAKFIAEAGYHGCPNIESLKKYIPDKDLWPIEGNKTWAHHSTEDYLIEDIIGRRNTLMANQVRILVGKLPDDLETFVKVSQISQAEAFKFFIERTRIKKWDMTGILWWNLLDGWPGISDAVVDYYFDKKLAFDVIRRVQEPVCVMLDEIKGWERAVYLANDTNTDKTVSYRVYTYEEGNTVLEGEAFIEKGKNMKIGEFFEIPGTKKLYIIEWIEEGKKHISHYMAGYPSFDTDTILKWYKVIKELD